MNLSMWMIANRLSALEPELHILHDAPPILKSARRAYATDCVNIYERGSDVICEHSSSGYMCFKNANVEEIFEIVQFVFDFYRDWQSVMEKARHELDYRQIIDYSWTIFHNPIILQDANFNVLALSNQYTEDEVNKDWYYLSTTGKSSISTISQLMGLSKNFMNNQAAILPFSIPDINTRMATIALYYNSLTCGRINIVEHDRPLNPGDEQSLQFMAGYIEDILGKLNEKSLTPYILSPILAKLVLNQHIVQEELSYWKAFLHWQAGDIFKVGILSAKAHSSLSIDNRISICSLLESNIRHCVSAQMDSNIVFLYKCSSEELTMEHFIETLCQNFHLSAGISLPNSSITETHYYYLQALASIQIGRNEFPEKQIYHFYDHALDYFLLNSEPAAALHACHPDILGMWYDSKDPDHKNIDTLHAYLNHERSYIKTADMMFLHRNSLVYRIDKIRELLKDDLDDPYCRNYLLTSIRVLKLLERQHLFPETSSSLET